jgi:dihydroxyacid dehydratase/phosphogluconate dehydratase
MFISEGQIAQAVAVIFRQGMTEWNVCLLFCDKISNGILMVSSDEENKKGLRQISLYISNKYS